MYIYKIENKKLILIDYVGDFEIKIKENMFF